MTKRKVKRDRLIEVNRALKARHLLDRMDLCANRIILRDCETALTDWQRMYAWDQSSEEELKKSVDRINKAGGTLAYIGKLLGRIREALR